MTEIKPCPLKHENTNNWVKHPKYKFACKECGENVWFKTEEPTIVKWEYTRTRSDAILRELGLEGWELVAVTTDRVFGSETYYLKRKLEG